MHVLRNTSDDRLTQRRAQSAVGRLLLLTIIAFAAALPQTATAQTSKNDSIEITTTIEGRIYTWRVTNNGSRSITRFEIPVFKVYDHHVPEGWDIQESMTRFGSAAESLEHAIAPGETKTFACRAASMTSVAAVATVMIGLDNGETVEMSGVWAPSQERWPTLLIPPLVISLLAIAYALRTRAKARRAARTAE